MTKRINSTHTNEFQYYQCCEEEGVEDMVVDARVLYELANELEELK